MKDEDLAKSETAPLKQRNVTEINIFKIKG